MAAVLFQNRYHYLRSFVAVDPIGDAGYFPDSSQEDLGASRGKTNGIFIGCDVSEGVKSLCLRASHVLKKSLLDIFCF